MRNFQGIVFIWTGTYSGIFKPSSLFFRFFYVSWKTKIQNYNQNPNIIRRESSKSKRQNKEKKERNETQPNSFFHINKH